MKSPVPLFLLFMVALPLTAASALPELQWLRKHGTWVPPTPPTAQVCRDGVTDSTGALIQVGGNSAPGSFSLNQFLALKYDTSGTLLWERTSPAEGGTGATAVAIDAANNVIFTGGPTIKYDAAGTLLWKTTSPGNTVDAAVDSAGDVYVCGNASGAAGLDFLVVKYSAAGTELWTRRYDGAAHLDDAAVAVVAVPGGGIAVTGYTTETVGGRNFMTVKYDAAGTPQWVKFYDSPEGGQDQAVGLVATLQGEIVVAGTSEGKVATLRYSAAGNQLQASRYEHVPKDSNNAVYDGPHQETCGGIALNSEGSVGVVLYSQYQIPGPPLTRPTDYFDTVLLQQDASGSTLSTVLRKDRIAVQLSLRVAGAPNGFGVAYSALAVATAYAHELYRVDRQGSVGWTLTNLNLPDQFRYGATFLAIDSAGNTLAGGSYTSPPPGDPFPPLYALRIGEPQVAVPPTALTGSASDLTWQTVGLSGTVNPMGRSTSWHFDYGETTAYGLRTPDQDAGSGAGDIAVAASAIPVSPGISYHFRIVATSTGGTSTGQDATFTVPYSPHQLWRIQQFGSLQASGSGPEEDPDRDGAENLLEYAFGSNPQDPAFPPQLLPYRFTDSASGFTYLAVDYPVNPILEDLASTPEASTDLSSWSTGSIEVTPLPDNRRRAVARGFQPFLRLRVSLK